MGTKKMTAPLLPVTSLKVMALTKKTMVLLLTSPTSTTNLQNPKGADVDAAVVVEEAVAEEKEEVAEEAGDAVERRAAKAERDAVAAVAITAGAARMAEGTATGVIAREAVGAT